MPWLDNSRCNCTQPNSLPEMQFTSGPSLTSNDAEELSWVWIATLKIVKLTPLPLDRSGRCQVIVETPRATILSSYTRRARGFDLQEYGNADEQIASSQLWAEKMVGGRSILAMTGACRNSGDVYSALEVTTLQRFRPTQCNFIDKILRFCIMNSYVLTDHTS